MYSLPKLLQLEISKSTSNSLIQSSSTVAVTRTTNSFGKLLLQLKKVEARFPMQRAICALWSKLSGEVSKSSRRLSAHRAPQFKDLAGDGCSTTEAPACSNTGRHQIRIHPPTSVKVLFHFWQSMSGSTRITLTTRTCAPLSWRRCGKLLTGKKLRKD